MQNLHKEKRTGNPQLIYGDDEMSGGIYFSHLTRNVRDAASIDQTVLPPLAPSNNSVD